MPVAVAMMSTEEDDGDVANPQHNFDAYKHDARSLLMIVLVQQVTLKCTTDLRFSAHCEPAAAAAAAEVDCEGN